MGGSGGGGEAGAGPFIFLQLEKWENQIASPSTNFSSMVAKNTSLPLSELIVLTNFAGL